MKETKIGHGLREYRLQEPDGYVAERRELPIDLSDILLEPIQTADILQEGTIVGARVLDHHGIVDDPKIQPLDNPNIVIGTAAYWATVLLKRIRHLKVSTEFLDDLLGSPERASLVVDPDRTEWRDAVVRSSFCAGFALGRLEELTFVPDGAKVSLTELAELGLARSFRDSQNGVKSAKARARWHGDAVSRMVEIRRSNPFMTDDLLAHEVHDWLKAKGTTRSVEMVLKVLKSAKDSGVLAARARREPRRTGK